MKKLLMKYYFGFKEEIVFQVGLKLQPGSLFAVIPPEDVWTQESLSKRIRSLLTFRYRPTEKLLQQEAKNVFIADIFGGPEDNGEVMLRIAHWHNSREWKLEQLTQSDAERAKAASVVTLGTRTRFAGKHFNVVHLQLADRSPEMLQLIAPITAKIPIIAVRYYLDIHYEFAFNAIRKSGHPKADVLIGYLYEVSLLQHKIITNLHEFIRLIIVSRGKKQEALLLQAEMDAAGQAESAITYLKASIEKMINLVALIFGIEKLDEKKTHKQKMEALRNGVPADVQNPFYWEVIYGFVSSDQIEELNRYRTGLVHKMGVSKLQPHQFVEKSAEESSFMEVFEFLHEQYLKNTMVFIGALALLADDLVKRDPLTAGELEEFGQLMKILYKNN